ncbi:MAG: tetratricopeptide repeat protein [Acidobacteriota bacterium]|nr:tetratricopeptide repeat protein [Acidobacteriota bacterium]MDE3265176.1 tetratricopeptide repeat protein [Acidobacteriota bacterium]
MKPIREPWTLGQPARPALFAAVLGICLSAALAAPAAAQLPGTVWGQIFDATTGDTLEGVEIIFTNPEAPTWREEFKSGRNGRFRIMIKNVVTHERGGFTVELKKEGYVTRRVVNVRIPARNETRLSQLPGGGDWNLTSQEEALKQQAAQFEAAGIPQPSQEVDLEAEARGSAIKLYNQGSNALNSGDYETAEFMFQSALEKKADLTQAMGGLARIYSQRGDHVRAVEFAEQVAAEGEDLENMNQILYAGYNALGMDDKAEAALASLQTTDPEKAAKNLYNEAADLYNAGSIPEALTKLEQVIGFNPSHPEALNMLGLCYAAQSENDKALDTFRKFLEVAPNHPEAATAQAMIEYFESL